MENNDSSILPPDQGISMFADLESYHRFLSQPDVQQHLWKHLDIVFDCISTTFRGGQAFWERPPKSYDPICRPHHTKFLGDGCMYVWRTRELGELELIELCDRLCILGQQFNRVFERCIDVIPGIWLPKRIRFGISAGTIFPRKPVKERDEYMDSGTIEIAGYGIGLASRLTAYCKKSPVTFIASARLPIKRHTLSRHRYIKTIAKNIREGVKEMVFLDEVEFEQLDEQTRDSLFEGRMNMVAA